MVKLGNSKILKPSKEDKSSSAIDRISALPDSLLSRILSLLPTKDAVATSCLSTRWKFRWTSITHLDFDDEVSNHPKICLVEKKNKFTHFVNRVLLLLNPPSMQNFHLKFHHKVFDPDPSYLNSWVCAAIGRTIQELVLSLRLEEPIELPLSQFYFQTPAVLKLSGDIHFNIPAFASASFPSLQSLHLYGISITIPSNSSFTFPKLKLLHLFKVKNTNEESIPKLVQSCPILEDLYIKLAPVVDVYSCLSICNPSLKSLKIARYNSSKLPLGLAPKIQIDTPSLEYLSLKASSMCWFRTADNLSSLLEAKVILRCGESLTPDHANSFSNNFIKFVEGLYKVKFLKISGLILKAIRSTSATFVSVFHNFHNLRRLELLGKDECSDWSLTLNGVLHYMDNLENLLMEGSYCDGSHESWWTEPMDVPKCLLSRLHTLSLRCNFICKDEIELVGYFLKNSQVLKLLTVDCCSYGSEKRSMLMQKISMYPRGSNACQVTFRFDES